MKMVYMASSGRYSDYHVECLFEQRADAEAWVALTDPEEGFVEEASLYEAGAAPKRWPHFTVAVDLTDDGHLVGDRVHTLVEHRTELTGDKGPPAQATVLRFREDYVRNHLNLVLDNPAYRRSWDDRPFMSLVLSGWDREAVTKAFADRFAQWAHETGHEGEVPFIDFDGAGEW